MAALNIATSLLLVAAAMALLVRSKPGLAAFVGLTGVAWSIHFLPVDRHALLRILFACLLAAASAVLVVLALRLAGTRGQPLWIAAGTATATGLAIFVGRGAAAILDSPATVAARAARDAGLGAFVFALVLFALAHPGRSRLPGLSAALLLYPGIVAGIYLHPESHRNMAGLALALILVSVLWLRNSHTHRATSRRAVLVALLGLALPLLALATVRLQGGLDAAAGGPLRSAARAAGPLLFVWLAARPAPAPTQPTS